MLCQSKRKVHAGYGDKLHCVMGKGPQMAQETTGSGVAANREPKEGAAGSTSTKMTDEERDQAAAKLVDRFCLWSGAAGLIPIPIVDIATVGGVQLQMLRRLSEIYGVPFSDNQGKSIIASVAGAVVPELSAAGISSAFKFVPVVGTAVGTCSMAVFSAGATWVIGKVFIQHFASGGTLLDFNPPDYREFIKAQKEKWNARRAATSSADKSASASRSTSSKSAAATST